MGDKKSFVVYFDYRQHLELLTAEEQGQLFMALFDYCESGVVPSFNGALRMAFSFIKSQLDRDDEKYKARCEKSRRAAEARWGNAEKTEATPSNAKNANACERMPSNAKHADTDNDTDNDNDTDTDNVTDTVTDNDTVTGTNNNKNRAKARKFVPPTVEEVDDYCWERQNNVDAQQFVDFYESKGWMVGKNKMKDWKAAVRTWENNRSASPPKPPNQNKEGRLDWIDGL